MKDASPRFTMQVALVMDVLISDPGASGAHVARVARLKSGTLYPILSRLVEAGMVEGERESGDAAVLGRPLRIFYRVTDVGRAWVRGEARAAEAVIARLAAD